MLGESRSTPRHQRLQPTPNSFAPSQTRRIDFGAATLGNPRRWGCPIDFSRIRETPHEIALEPFLHCAPKKMIFLLFLFFLQFCLFRTFLTNFAVSGILGDTRRCVTGENSEAWKLTDQWERETFFLFARFHDVHWSALVHWLCGLFSFGDTLSRRKWFVSMKIIDAKNWCRRGVPVAFDTFSGFVVTFFGGPTDIDYHFSFTFPFLNSKTLNLLFLLFLFLFM